MTYIKRLVMQGFKSFAKRTEVNFDRGINVVVGPNGSGKCLTEDSVVSLADGSLQTIGNIVNSRLENGVRTEDGFIIPGDGTKVMCLDMKTLKITNKNIKAFIKRTSPDKLLRIKTRSGREITSTKYHPFFILKEGKVVPAKAEEINIGTRIAVPRRLNFKPETKYFVEILDEIKLGDNVYVPYKEEFANILKLIKEELTWKSLAEKIDIPSYAIKGLLDKQSINIYYLIKILRNAQLSDIQIIDLTDEIISNGNRLKLELKNSPEFARFLGYLLAEGRLSNSSSQIWFTNGSKEIVEDYVGLVRKLFEKEPLIREYKPNCWDVIIFSEPLKRILAKLGMSSKTENKDISNIILKHSGEEEIGNLLGGMYSGDGYVSKESTIEITTKSKKLAEKIEQCLLRLGITFRIRKMIKRIKSLGFEGEYLSVISYGAINAQIFRDKVNILHEMKRNRIDAMCLKKHNSNIDLIEANELIMDISKDNGINIKKIKKEIPILDSYCYNQCIPSRHGINQLLQQQLFVKNTPSLQQLKSLAMSDIIWEEILEKEEVSGVDWVYDLTVEDDHNFIANNIVAHNSNVSDALCFVLGRLSIKSMRAAKAKNLLFMGSKYAKPVREASVEMVFDNSDKTFNIDSEEVSLQRIVRINGASIYKINQEVKTRLEVIETLAQAGIDPYGFNLVLQGQIQAIIRMHPEDRRKIIEEVAGIAIYESRKERSLKELEKTDERLKEINAVLREKGAFLRNLEKERGQAMKFKDLELTVRRANATIISKKIADNKKELESIENSIEDKTKQKDKKKAESEYLHKEIEQLGEKANGISKYIQQASGMEQETLHNHVANLRVEIEGLRVRKENYENRKSESERRISEIQKNIPELEKEISELKSESPLLAKKAQELKQKKDELSELEDERRKIQGLRNELNSIKERIKDKERAMARAGAESEHIIKQLEDYAKLVTYKNEDECSKAISNLKEKNKEARNELDNINKEMLIHEKRISVSESEISKAEKVKGDVSSIDTCPLCRSKITADHISHVSEEQERTIISGRKIIAESNEQLKVLGNKRRTLYIDLQNDEQLLNKAEVEQVRHKTMKEKQDQLKKAVEEEKQARIEVQQLEAKRKSLEEKSGNINDIEEKYHNKMLEIEEISSRSSKDTDNSLLYKSRDLEKYRLIIKQASQDIESINSEIKEMANNLQSKQKMLEEKESQEKELQAKFKKLFEERESIQKEIQEKSFSLNESGNEVRGAEDQVNFLKIGKAKVDAMREGLEMEMVEYSGVELLQGSLNAIEERLQKAKESLQMIGSINMRALEVYDELNKEFISVQEKVAILDKEKIDIMSIVAEIDAKKKRTFMKTFKAMSDLFSENFSRLYTKGVAFLEMENQEDIFSGGVSIVVRLAKGKYFDVTSLSGGEQTLVALALLFAIQEYKPYHFYVFDEIDAALDKRNSERLAGLLTQYMKSGQYIVVTHNDAIIMNANLLYGVSMHDGVSKILSLNLKDSLKTAHDIQAQEAQKEAEDAKEKIAEVKDKIEELNEIVNESENDKMAHDIVDTKIVADDDDAKA